jgi:hypothetical protein
MLKMGIEGQLAQRDAALAGELDDDGKDGGTFY